MKETRLWRLLRILRLTSGSRRLNAKEMSEELGISRRTFHRDREVLDRAGIPIVYDGEGYSLAGSIFLPAVHLQWDEGLALLLTLRATMDSGGTPFVESLESAMTKIESGIPPVVRAEIAATIDALNVEWRPMVDMSEHRETFDLVWRACRESSVIEITYWGRTDGDPSRREIEPLAIFHRWRAWYLVAHCRMREELRTFRIDRMLDVEAADERFVPPRDFDLDSFLSEAWLVERGEATAVRIAFSGIAARLIRELTWHPSQVVEEDPDGRTVARFRTGGLGEIAEWVLGFGGEAEVIEPEELRSMVANSARSILHCHSR